MTATDSALRTTNMIDSAWHTEYRLLTASAQEYWRGFAQRHAIAADLLCWMGSCILMPFLFCFSLLGIYVVGVMMYATNFMLTNIDSLLNGTLVSHPVFKSYINTIQPLGNHTSMLHLLELNATVTTACIDKHDALFRANCTSGSFTALPHADSYALMVIAGCSITLLMIGACLNNTSSAKKCLIHHRFESYSNADELFRVIKPLLVRQDNTATTIFIEDLAINMVAINRMLRDSSFPTTLDSDNTIIFGHVLDQNRLVLCDINSMEQCNSTDNYIIITKKSLRKKEITPTREISYEYKSFSSVDIEDLSSLMKSVSIDRETIIQFPSNTISYATQVNLWRKLVILFSPDMDNGIVCHSTTYGFRFVINTHTVHLCFSNATELSKELGKAHKYIKMIYQTPLLTKPPPLKARSNKIGYADYTNISSVAHIIRSFMLDHDESLRVIVDCNLRKFSHLDVCIESMGNLKRSSFNGFCSVYTTKSGLTLTLVAASHKNDIIAPQTDVIELKHAAR